MKKRNVLLLLLTLTGFSPLFAQSSPDSQKNSRDRLVTREVIFQGEENVLAADSARSRWEKIGNFNLPEKLLVSKGGSGNYKWRLHMFYSVDEDNSELALQARILVNSVQNPTFTLGWDKGKSGIRSAYTNWLRPDFFGFTKEATFPVYISLKKGAASNGSSIRLQLVELEVWEEVLSPVEQLNQNNDQAKIAAAPNLRPSVENNRPPVNNIPQKQIDNPREAVLSTGIAFLKAAASGDKEKLRSLMAKNMVSLSDLNVIPWAGLPLFKLKSGQSFAEYMDNYDPTVFSYAEFEGLFDDWESHFVDGWQVSSNSYLFIGNHLKPWGSDIFADQTLVFIVEEEDGVMKVKAFP